MTTADLLSSPKKYLSELRNDPDAFPWEPALVGYALVSLLENSENVQERNPDWSTLVVLGMAAIGSVVIGVWLQVLLVGAVWMHLGSKLVRGTSPATATIKAVGYAAVLPCGLALPGALLAIVGTRAESFALMIIGLLWQTGFGLWGFVRMVSVVKALNNFGMPKAVVVALWVPVVLLLGLLGYMAASQ